VIASLAREIGARGCHERRRAARPDLGTAGSEPAQEARPGDEATAAAHGRRRLRRVGGPEPPCALGTRLGRARRGIGAPRGGVERVTPARRLSRPRRVRLGIALGRAAKRRGRGRSATAAGRGPAEDVLLLHVGERVKYFVLKGRRGEDPRSGRVPARADGRARGMAAKASLRRKSAGVLDLGPIPHAVMQPHPSSKCI